MQVQVAPNPATDYILVKAQGSVAVSLYNQSGQRVAAAAIPENEREVRLQTASLPRGCYRLEVKGEDGVVNMMVTLL
jgi:hypothetical protein